MAEQQDRKKNLTRTEEDEMREDSHSAMNEPSDLYMVGSPKNVVSGNSSPAKPRPSYRMS